MNSSVEDMDMDGDCDHPSVEDYEALDNLTVIVEGYISLAISSLGIIANILAISIFLKKSFWSNFTNLLVVLAVADILFLIFTIIEIIRKIFQGAKQFN